jgi:16S rRNA (uracil1498-N3)-methyltransferase
VRSGWDVVPSVATLHHLCVVLRLKPGDGVLLVDKDGVAWDAVLVSGPEGSLLRVGDRSSSERVVRQAVRWTLVLALLKGDRTEWAIQKATEAGVADVVIVVCDRSVPRPAGQDSGRRTERLRKVAIEATRQTGRASPPKVDLVFSVDEAMQVLAADDMLVGDSPEMSVPLPESLGLVRPRYVLDETPGTLSLAKLLAAGQSAGGAVLAVGPEGSFSDREHALLSSVGFVRAGLGPRVLRAETAAITAVIVAQTVVGDMK